MSSPSSAAPDFIAWTWVDIEPRYAALQSMPVTEHTVEQFLADWTALADRVQELGQRLKVASDANTADTDVAERYQSFVKDISPRVEEAEQRLKEKVLSSGLQPPGMEVPLARMRVEAELFREENLPLLAEEKLLEQEYFKVTGAQTVEWDGKEVPLVQMRAVLEEPDRGRRESAWRLMTERRIKDGPALDDIWSKLLALRRQIAANAGFDDYRAYRWRDLKRFDYRPEDAQEFDRSVERVVVPAVSRRYERRRQLLGVETLRPWDLYPDPLGRSPLRPYSDTADLMSRASTVFHHVDPTLGEYFDTMRREGLLDLDSRENKAPSGYCTVFGASHRPFIFMVGSGTRLDVETLMHEGGHAFHIFEMSHLPYNQQRNFDMPIEFAEVGSMAMEFLTEPYLGSDLGGFYTAEEVVRTRLDHMEERVLAIWVRLSMADAFQHWCYEHPDDASDPATCDATWAELTSRFLPVIDWSGLEREVGRGWRDILHIMVIPFYIIEYAFAQLGAVQVWGNAQRDRHEAVRLYRHALSLGGTRSLPDLFTAAGARFAFDEQTLRDAVALIENTMAELETASPSRT